MQSKVTEHGEADVLAEELRENGVISIDSYLDDETCDEIREKVVRMLDNDEFEMAGDEMTGSEMMSASETIVNERTGEDDDGMLNIYNIDATIPRIQEIKTDEFINEIINTAGDKKFAPENINIYYNESVSNTRGYHFDSYNSQYKTFVYLTDVPNESYGPYSFIKGSHKRSYPRRRIEGIANRIRGEKPTAAISYDEDDIVTFTAPKGTLIISDQTGYHRGIPQEQGKERMVITNSHTPASL